MGNPSTSSLGALEMPEIEPASQPIPVKHRLHNRMDRRAVSGRDNSNSSSSESERYNNNPQESSSSGSDRDDSSHPGRPSNKLHRSGKLKRGPMCPGVRELHPTEPSIRRSSCIELIDRMIRHKDSRLERLERYVIT